MNKVGLSCASYLARTLPPAAKNLLRRFPFLAKLIRSSIDTAVRNELAAVQIAAGTIRGYRILLNLKTEKSQWLGSYEPQLEAALHKFLQPGMTAYDVGANIGYVTLMIAHNLGAGGRTYAFEALPANVERIRQTAALNRLNQVTVIHAAVTNRSGPVTFLLHESGGMGKTAESAGGHGHHSKGEIKVPGLSLDEFVYQQGNPAPDAVKMDIEGGEILALPGMKRILAEHHPLLFLELHGPDAQRMAWEFLTAEGYSFQKMAAGYPRIFSREKLTWQAFIIARYGG